jgi:uncharacterized protein YkwD
MPAAFRAAGGFALLAATLLFAAPAHAASCRGADDRGGTNAERTSALRCLAAQARAKAGRPRLRAVKALRRSASVKAATIERCRSFSHTPCGRPMAQAMTRTGYARGCFTVGENLAWVTLGSTPRQVLRAWMQSPGHRANLLDTRFRHTGVARRVMTLPEGRVEVWVQHFGTRC